MKANKYMAALVAGLTGVLSTGVMAALPDVGTQAIPNGFRLAGWDDFGVGAQGAPVYGPSYGGGQLLATSVLPGGTGHGTAGAFGDTDANFGASNWIGTTTDGSGNYNGAVSLDTATPNVFTLTNVSAGPTPVRYLMVDSMKKDQPAVANLLIYYTPNLGLPSLQETHSLAIPVGQYTFEDYDDHTFNLSSLNITLQNGESISFSFVRSGAGSDPLYIDNIALSSGILNPVPEPGSMLALGCFLGSGLLIRRNRRNVA